MKLSRTAAALLSTAALIFTLSATGCALSPAANTSSPDSGLPAASTSAATSAVTTVPQGKLYRNGVYEGIGYGKNGAIQVRLELREDRIVSLELAAQKDTPDYIQPAWERIRDQLLGQDSPDPSQIDAVSGATASSQGILDAIQSALYKARR